MVKIDVEISTEDRDRLAVLFNGDADIDRIIRIIAKAGTAELMAQATGRAVFSTMTDLRLYRIFRLLRAGATLTEAESLVSFLFKAPLKSARRLVENALARYEVEERDQVRDCIAQFLEAAALAGATLGSGAARRLRARHCPERDGRAQARRPAAGGPGGCGSSRTRRISRPARRSGPAAGLLTECFLLGRRRGYLRQ